MPYVSRNVPKIDYKIKEHRRIDLDPEFLEKIDNRIADQIQGGLVVHEKAEKVAAKMITDGSLSGSIDEMEGVLYFNTLSKDESSLLRWDETIITFCGQLNKVTDAVRAN